jgi:hypothetical protein
MSPGRFAVCERYVVRPTREEREDLEALVRRGRAHARKLLYARILLKADASEGGPAWTDERIAEALETSADTVARERRRFCEDGLEVALMAKKPGKPRRRVLDGRSEARLVALACSDSPEGRVRRTLRLLADRMVELGAVEGVSRETVRRALKNELRPHLVKEWVIPPRESAAFVWRMEEVLDLYEEPYDRRRPVVCFDERPCQLIGDVRAPLPARPGGPAGEARLADHEYERGGTANVHLSFEPLAGRRRVEVTKRRRKQEFAEQVRRVAEEDYPEAQKIRLVLDNLSTHTPPPSTRPSIPSGRGVWPGVSSSSTRRCTARG